MKLILTLIVLAGLATASFAEHTRTRVLTAGTLGAFAKTDESEALRLWQANNDADQAALAEMLSTGRVVSLEAGTTVYFIDVDYSLDLCRVRIAGSPETVWIPSDALSGD